MLDDQTLEETMALTHQLMHIPSMTRRETKT